VTNDEIYFMLALEKDGGTYFCKPLKCIISNSDNMSVVYEAAYFPITNKEDLANIGGASYPIYSINTGNVFPEKFPGNGLFEITQDIYLNGYWMPIPTLYWFY
jgi:hypothetical protein